MGPGSAFEFEEFNSSRFSAREITPNNDNYIIICLIKHPLNISQSVKTLSTVSTKMS